jgi:4-hydroxy-3-methylbut-2-enyl diphosphate reductase
LAWFDNVDVVGVSAGASVPEVLVEEVLEHLEKSYGAKVEQDDEGFDEDVSFPIPVELREVESAP